MGDRTPGRTSGEAGDDRRTPDDGGADSRWETPIDPTDAEVESADGDPDRFRTLLDLLDLCLRPDTATIGPEPAGRAGGEADTSPPPNAVPAWADLPGTIGRFRIERELGRGGFGVVFLAADPQMDRKVALKIPRPDSLPSPDIRRRFLREARHTARLAHPNLVPVYEAGEAGPLCYIASAYCEGPTLRRWLRDGNAPLDPRRAARLALTLAQAIEHMHGRGLLHCDLKPENILLDVPEGDAGADPVPRITDFGLARLTEAARAESTASRSTTTHFWGTPPYMAPEQIEQRSKAIGPASDIYAIGAILCELLTGRPPHEGANAWELIRAVVSEPPARPRAIVPSVPRDLEAIALKCLEKRPDRRYASAAELADDLQRFLDRRPTRARPLGLLRRSARWSARHPAGAGLIGLGMLTVALSLGAAIVLTRAVRDLDRANAEARLALGRERAQRYVASLTLAQEEIRRGRYAQAQRLLRALSPPPGSTDPDADPRDFAWHYLWRQSRRDRTVLDDLFPSTPCSVSAGEGVLLGFTYGQRGSGVWSFDRPSALGPHPLGTHRLTPRFGRPPGFDPGVNHAGTVSADGRFAVILTETAPGRARISFVDPIGRRVLATDSETPSMFDRVAISRDADAIAHGSLGWQYRLGRRELTVAGRRIAVLEVPSGRDSVFTGDGRRIASSVIADDPTTDRVFLLWDANTGALITETKPGEIAWPLAASPVPGGLLATPTLEGRILLREPDQGKVVATIAPPAGTDPDISALAFSPDGKRLLAGYDRTAVLWDVAERRELARFTGLTARIWSAAFLPGTPGDIAFGVGAGEVVIWHGEPVEEAVVPLRHGDEAWDVAFDPNGRRLASIGGDRLVRRWDVATGRELPPLAGHEEWPSCLAFDPARGTLVSADFSGRLLIWDEEAGRPGRTLEAHEGRVWALAFSPNGRWLASAGRDRSVRIWDAASWEPVATLRGHTLDVRGLAFAPDGRTLVSVGDDAAVVLWDLAASRERARWTAPIDATSVAFAPDGRTLAVGDIGGTATLWDPVAGTQLASVPGLHAEEVGGLAFSPDGRVLAMAGQDGIVSLVDVGTGQAHLSLTGHEGGVNAVAWSPDGRTLASASHDGTVRLWWAGPEMSDR